MKPSYSGTQTDLGDAKETEAAWQERAESNHFLGNCRVIMCCVFARHMGYGFRSGFSQPSTYLESVTINQVGPYLLDCLSILFLWTP